MVGASTTNRLETREVELVELMMNLLPLLVRTETGTSLFNGSNAHWMFTGYSVGLKHWRFSSVGSVDLYMVHVYIETG